MRKQSAEYAASQDSQCGLIGNYFQKKRMLLIYHRANQKGYILDRVYVMKRISFSYIKGSDVDDLRKRSSLSAWIAVFTCTLRPGKHFCRNTRIDISTKGKIRVVSVY